MRRAGLHLRFVELFLPPRSLSRRLNGRFVFGSPSARLKNSAVLQLYMDTTKRSILQLVIRDSRAVRCKHVVRACDNLSGLIIPSGAPVRIDLWIEPAFDPGTAVDPPCPYRGWRDSRQALWNFRCHLASNQQHHSRQDADCATEMIYGGHAAPSRHVTVNSSPFGS